MGKYNDEEKIRRKLENASVENLGYKVSPNQLWGNIAQDLPEKKVVPIRLYLSHAAAVLIGAVFSGAVLLFFLNKQDHPIAPSNAKTTAGVVQRNLPAMLSEKDSVDLIRTGVRRSLKDKAVASSPEKMPRKTTSPGIAAKQVQLSTHPVHSSKFAEENSVGITPNGVSYQVTSPLPPKPEPASRQVVYWSDIKTGFVNENQQQPQSGLASRFRFQEETNKQQENTTAPVIVWVQSFSK